MHHAVSLSKESFSRLNGINSIITISLIPILTITLFTSATALAFAAIIFTASLALIVDRLSIVGRRADEPPSSASVHSPNLRNVYEEREREISVLSVRKYRTLATSLFVSIECALCGNRSRCRDNPSRVDTAAL